MVNIVELRDIAEVITKGTTPTSIGFNFSDNGVNFIKVESISSNGGFIQDKFKHISNECNEKMLRSQLKKNDILFSIAGAIGRIAIVNDECLPGNINQALAIIRIGENVIDYKYLYYLLNSEFILKQIESQKQGVAQINLSLKNVGDLQIPIVSLKNQKLVVKCLDLVCLLIEEQNKQLSKLDELVKARFVEMFGDPVLNSKEWNISNLNDVTTKIGSGATPKGGKSSYKDEGVSLIRSMNVHDKKFEYKDLAHITDEQALELKNVIVYKNDVLINITGASVARSCIVPSDVLPARVNQHVSIIRFKPDIINYVFANNLFLSEPFKMLLLATGESGGATRQAITKQQLENLNIITPPLQLQNKFAEFVEQVEKSKQEIQQSIEKLETLKKSLMQEYFG